MKETGIPEEQRRREQALVDSVVSSFDAAESSRLGQLMQSLARHLHEFIREVRLTEDEWRTAVEFLTETGRITDERRQEFILLSDVLGLSMQTITVNNEAVGDATEATVLGPFFVQDAPLIPLGGDMSFGADGQPCWVEGTVTDIHGRPVAGARLDVWEADAEGLYDVQYDDQRVAARAHMFADDAGGYRFWAITPTPYPIPFDGPVGALLQASERSPMRPAHLHFMVSAPGHRTLVTHIFVAGSAHLATDAVFGVTDSLVKELAVHDTGSATPDGRHIVGGTWAELRFDIVLAPSTAGRDHAGDRRERVGGDGSNLNETE